jgi:adenylate cyclase
MSALSSCVSCGIELREGARFCDGCGAPIASQKSAEYKQVTVLFADVVQSMDIAKAVGAERLREIMADLFDCCAGIVTRYSGTVDKFTGDGIMAVFGAPIALEDHALRACLTALDIQTAMHELADQVRRRDHVHIELRVGLNSGEVIAGDIGSSNPWSYTAVGHQVGMAQRMESLAHPGGVMLSESTARLVADVALLGEPEDGRIKGSDESVPARPLLSIRTARSLLRPRQSTLVGRKWELAALTAMLDQSVSGRGCAVGVVGPGGIGKSRAVEEVVALAEAREVRVFSTYCESHTSEVPFLVVARLMRAAFGVEGMTDHQAREVLRERAPYGDDADRVLLDDTLGIRDPADPLPDIATDARRRRLKALISGIAVASVTPSVYVIEDAHWIDPTSESLLADFLPVVPQTHSLVLITYRPEYSGALSRLAGAQTISLAPLAVSETTELVTQLLGTDPSVAGLASQIVDRAAGNPLFVEEMVRDLTDRGLLQGRRGAYVGKGGSTDVIVPATLQAAIAARIDRLDAAAKATLNAASVIGVRFRADLLAALADTAMLPELVGAELVDQMTFTAPVEYAFRQPLIQAVAYKSQLKSGRTTLHRRLAGALAERDPKSADEHAALIAEHLQAAGDLPAAFGWHMRAGTWLTKRDMRAARQSWLRARQVADQLPAEEAGRAAMQIAPRTLLCFSAWRVGDSVDDAGFAELQELATAADDKASLTIGMAGQVMALVAYGHYDEAADMVPELVNLVDSGGASTLSNALLFAALTAKFGTGEMAEALQLADRIVDVVAGDPNKDNNIFGSPLRAAMMLRAAALMCGGAGQWREEVDVALATGDEIEPGLRSALLLYIHGIGVANGLMLPDSQVLSESERNLRVASERGDEFALASANLLQGIILTQHEGARRTEGFEFLNRALAAPLHNRIHQEATHQLETERAKEQARTGDLDGAITLLRSAFARQTTVGFRAPVTTALVEVLLRRGRPADVNEATAVIEQLAAVPTEPGFVLFDVALQRLWALHARARGDDDSYREYAERFGAMATSFGFEGLVKIAGLMLDPPGP